MLVYNNNLHLPGICMYIKSKEIHCLDKPTVYVLLYFIPNTFACKSVFNFVKILSSYIILTLHIDIEYLDTSCFVSFVFFILFSPIIFGLSLVCLG